MIFINGAKFKYEDQSLVTAMVDLGYRDLYDPNLRISINKQSVKLNEVEKTHLTDGDKVDITRIPMREFYL